MLQSVHVVSLLYFLQKRSPLKFVDNRKNCGEESGSLFVIVIRVGFYAINEPGTALP